MKRWPVVAAVVVFVLAWLDVVQHYPGAGELVLPVALGLAVPVLVCGQRPVIAGWFGWAAAAGTALVTQGRAGPGEPWPWSVSSVVVLVVLCGVVGALGVRRTTVGLVGAVGLTGIVLVLVFDGQWVSAISTVMLCAAAALVGDWRAGMRGRLAEADRLGEEERARRMVLEERARIAREMHDIVAHHMSMVAVAAETAPYRNADLPESARTEFAGIADSARASLTEMRLLLGILREGAAELGPQPGIDRLAELVDGVRGAPVTLECSVGTLPAALGLTVYRVVQEALSNVVRHAPGAATRVTVGMDGSELALEVVNDAPKSAPVTTAGGHGLVGVRERVALHGGTLSVDRPAGGYRLRVRLPVEGR
ncbi:sensor histidine kinase [Actinokineospora xionganensis]|uniref:histidine kinase n=1 Tax=Actinokineospora xionganensis TaxID=2684470 RepID=A0ABR7LGR7_9PSEU|nr:histidine kinase [Actinokineospora xionganensis]MBC6451673.1 sensor histidine kinase [Actinokineospora xionganensis]